MRNVQSSAASRRHGTAQMAQQTTTDLERRLAQAERQLGEALERQAATDEVLRVIASSPGELEPVFRAILANAVRICDAKFGNLLLYDDEEFRIAARMSSAPSDWVKAQRDPVVRPGPNNPIHRLVATQQTLPSSMPGWNRHIWSRIHLSCRWSMWPAREPNGSDAQGGGRLVSTARRCDHSPTSRSSW